MLRECLEFHVKSKPITQVAPHLKKNKTKHKFRQNYNLSNLHSQQRIARPGKVKNKIK